ncbi:MAG: ferredoxin [Phycisphaeraceae bacterium]|nr:ferredoxin [Phycisphaeraceae bacterium]
MPIDPSEIQKRRDRLTGILSDIVRHADEQAQCRCPYKNRFDQCTAAFGCRNKRKPKEKGQLPVCAHDDQLDYRTAWETEPESYEPMRDQIRAGRSSEKGGGAVAHEDVSRPAIAGRTIFDYADEFDVRVPTSCGRTGHCHECVVEIQRGAEALGAPTESEAFLKPPFRLACQAVLERADQDVTFAILRRAPKILPAGEDDAAAPLDPMVTRRGDGVFYGDEQIDRDQGTLYGLAIDVGTTTVVAVLIDLESGRAVYETSFENPQRFGGSDIMHRISYDAQAFQGELHRAIINAVNSEIRVLCQQLSIRRQQIYEVVIVGNSTMRDLFFGLDVQTIGEKPYKSTIEHEFIEGRRSTTALNESARHLGLYVNRNARVFGAPLIASHVGADVAADLVMIDIAAQDQTVMLVDVGTNTEVVIGHRGRLMAASCPAGPAFEGGLVTFGMPGCEGAIESIRYVDGRFEYKTIGDGPPRGICGSGLIDLLAELRRHDLMTPKGVFPDRRTEHEIVPEHGITFSRRDASELAQAKAANTCGQAILMRRFGVRPDDIHRLYLAGGFANYVDAASAVDIGFLAPVPFDRIEKIGNSAARGAGRMLRSRRCRESIEALVRTIEHVELETMDDFFEVFVEGCQMKPASSNH